MPPQSDYNRELNTFLCEDGAHWINYLPGDKTIGLRTEAHFAPLASNRATSKIASEEQTVDQLLGHAKQKLQTTRIPHFLRITMYLKFCCLALQQSVLAEQQTPIGSLYHTLLQWLWECEPDWWKQCTITDSYQVTSDNARIQDLLQPLQDFVKQFSEA